MLNAATTATTEVLAVNLVVDRLHDETSYFTAVHMSP